MTWPVHPLADVFPPMSEPEYAALRADIAQNGIIQPLYLWNGHLVDGRHRMRAASELGITPNTETLACKESDLPAKLMSLNVHRRHLSDPQRELIAARMANVKQGANRHTLVDISKDMSRPAPLITTQRAADIMGVSKPQVLRAARVIREAAPETVAAIERGEKTVGRALAEIGSPTRARKVNPTPNELRQPTKQRPRTEQFERTLHAIETHVETLTEIGDSVAPTEDWITRLRAVRRDLATITHALEKGVAAA